MCSLYRKILKQLEEHDKTLEEYFSNRELIRVLCRLRASIAKKRHDQQFLFNLSVYAPAPGSHESEDDSRLCNMLPPRKEWSRLTLAERKHKNTLEVNALSIERAVLIEFKRRDRGVSIIKPWFAKLNEFLHEVQDIVLHGKCYHLNSPYIQPIRKNSNSHEYRVIALYNLFDKIIIGQVSKYFRTVFNPDFLGSSYAFRVKAHDKPCPDHHDAVKGILQYRANFANQELWVAECDIQGFFDCVEHGQVRKAFQKAQERARHRGALIDSRAIRFFHQYLNSYSFTRIAKPQAQKWFLQNDPDGQIKPVDAILSQFYCDISSRKIGIPQGGALSCLIANLILDEADREADKYGELLFYARYCDDMVMIHPNQEQCKAAFESYQETLNKLKLPIHMPQEISRYSKEFWGCKSKQPYLWGDKNEDQAVPWIGFVGYQIRYDGCIRIRPSSLLKEFEKQIAETDKVLQIIFEVSDKTKGITEGTYRAKEVRRTPRQIIYRLTQRLIAMSVGHRKLDTSFDSIRDFCWCRGFKLLREYPFIKSQLQRLDRGRNYQIRRAKRLLRHIPPPPKPARRAKRVIKYFGKPFSYSAQFSRPATTTALRRARED